MFHVRKNNRAAIRVNLMTGKKYAWWQKESQSQLYQFKKVLYIKDKYMINKYRINIYYLMIYRYAEIRTLEVKENVTDIGVKL